MDNERDRHHSHPFERNVMDAIRTGRIQMRPRWKFVLSSVLAAVGGAILLLTLLYIVSFGIFVLRQSGALFVPIFGMRGLLAFAGAIPGILVFLLVVFVVILEILVRRYAFGYRRPLLVSVLAICIIVLVGGYVIERTRIHDQLLRASQGQGLGPLGAMYRSGSQHVPGIFRGTIISIGTGGFVMIDENGAGTTTVLVGPDTRLPLGAGFTVGQEIVVFGDEGTSAVHALGIREVQD